MLVESISNFSCDGSCLFWDSFLTCAPCVDSNLTRTVSFIRRNVSFHTSPATWREPFWLLYFDLRLNSCKLETCITTNFALFPVYLRLESTIHSYCRKCECRLNRQHERQGCSPYCILTNKLNQTPHLRHYHRISFIHMDSVDRQCGCFSGVVDEWYVLFVDYVDWLSWCTNDPTWCEYQCARNGCFLWRNYGPSSSIIQRTAWQSAARTFIKRQQRTCEWFIWVRSDFLCRDSRHLRDVITKAFAKLSQISWIDRSIKFMCAVQGNCVKVCRFSRVSPFALPPFPYRYIPIF